MVHLNKTDVGQFCWLDLAATDAEKAKTFYENLFGWSSYEQPANGGSFTRLRLWGHDVGSLYQLRGALLKHGIPSHWTPYVRVDDVENAVQRDRPRRNCSSTEPHPFRQSVQKSGTGISDFFETCLSAIRA